MNIRLKEYIQLEYVENSTHIKKGDILLEIEDSEKVIFNILKKRKWNKNDLPTELKNFIIQADLVCVDYDTPKDFEFSKNLYYFENRLPFSRKSPITFQKELSNKRVLIIGCGGIGTVVLQNLIFFGFKKFTLIDNDEVNIHNLNRQLFFNKKDLSKSKVDVLKKKIKEFSIDIDIESFNIYIEEENNFFAELLNKEKIDFVIGAADTPFNINHILSEICIQYNIPFISGSVGINSANWGPIVTEKSKLSKQNKFSGNLQGSISSTNMLLGSFIANDILEFFLDSSQMKLYKKKIINFKNYSIEVV
ncbi:MAG: ThiF family adenylyltransferase [Fusobacterium sp.]|nr:ThiF family adenylyltransferase [Fusobacterium sp.]